MESLEVTARTVNEAIAKALARLGKQRHEVEISVLAEGSRGILGIGGEDARILVSPKEFQPRERQARPAPTAEPRLRDLPGERRRGASFVPGPVAPVAPGPVAPLAPSPVAPVAAPAREPHGEKPTPAEIADTATEIVESLLSGMGFHAEVEARPVSDDAAENGFATSLNVIGPDLGILIGRRGETLGALQFVTNLILGKRLRRWAKVQVDVQDYRVRREQVLRTLAQRMALRVQETGLPLALEAMPANERRVIHLALSSHPAVTTASHGEGEQRRVTISPRH